MRYLLSITTITLLLALLPTGSPQTMDAYNSTEEVEEAESFFSSMDFHVSQSVSQSVSVLFRVQSAVMINLIFSVNSHRSRRFLGRRLLHGPPLPPGSAG